MPINFQYWTILHKNKPTTMVTYLKTFYNLLSVAGNSLKELKVVIIFELCLPVFSVALLGMEDADSTFSVRLIWNNYFCRPFSYSLLLTVT